MIEQQDIVRVSLTDTESGESLGFCVRMGCDGILHLHFIGDAVKASQAAQRYMDETASWKPFPIAATQPAADLVLSDLFLAAEHNERASRNLAEAFEALREDKP